jgi:hypothetical protein
MLMSQQRLLAGVSDYQSCEVPSARAEGSPGEDRQKEGLTRWLVSVEAYGQIRQM